MPGALTELAEAVGIASRWRDVHGQWHDASSDTIRTILAALGLPGGTEAEIADSQAALRQHNQTLPPLLTTTVHQPLDVGPGRWQVTFEDGGAQDGDGPVRIDRPGYHRLAVAGAEITLACAPEKGRSVPHRCWALAVQLYALRRPGDGGLGDFRALQDLIGPAARAGAAGVAISPVHAQFSRRHPPLQPLFALQPHALQRPPCRDRSRRPRSRQARSRRPRRLARRRPPSPRRPPRRLRRPDIRRSRGLRRVADAPGRRPEPPRRVRGLARSPVRRRTLALARLARHPPRPALARSPRLRRSARGGGRAAQLHAIPRGHRNG